MHLLCLPLYADLKSEQFFIKQPSSNSHSANSLINVRRAQRGMAGMLASQQPKGKDAVVYGASSTA